MICKKDITDLKTDIGEKIGQKIMLVVLAMAGIAIGALLILNQNIAVFQRVCKRIKLF